MGDVITQTLQVTPDQAAAWLRANTRNRGPSTRRAAMIAEDIVAGRWRENTEISFYLDGVLADGQTRLTAIVLSGRTVRMRVSWGHPLDSIFDDVRVRATADQIAIMAKGEGMEHLAWAGQRELATAKKMHMILTNDRKLISLNQLADMATRWKNGIEFSIGAIKSHKRYLSTSTVAASVAIASYFEDHNRLAQFCEVLVGGVVSSMEDNAAIRLREWLISNRGMYGGQTESLEGARKTEWAIKAFCDRRPVKSLKCPEGYPYGNPVL